MADLKSIAAVRIGGPKYPEKKRINLHQKENKKETVIAELIAFVIFWILLYFFVQFAILAPMRAADIAEERYRNTMLQLESLKEANSAMDEVTVEYAHYGSSYLTEEEAGTPDRIKMLGTLKTTIFPLCQSVSVVSINEDHMDITCVLPKGTVLANLIAQIEQDGTVCYVAASLESTKEQEAGSIDAIAAEKPVDVVLSVSFYKPGESGETSKEKNFFSWCSSFWRSARSGTAGSTRRLRRGSVRLTRQISRMRFLWSRSRRRSSRRCRRRSTRTRRQVFRSFRRTITLKTRSRN